MNKEPSYERGLFEEELKILQSASCCSGSQCHQNNPLLPIFEQLVFNYKKLLNLVSKIFRISDSQQLHLKRIETALKTLLDNAGQGFLTFGSDLIVNREYSAECLNIFKVRIEGTNVLQLLSSSENEEQNKLFAQIFTKLFQIQDPAAQNSLLQQLPEKIWLNGRYIGIDYKMVSWWAQKGDREAVMLILSDITENVAVKEKIIHMSYHDELTGLFNRAYIERISNGLYQKSKQPVSIIVADMNGLKLTNDVFGHVAGDKLLVKAAGIFRKCCRPGDIIVRWGGDEFLIILPQTGKQACEAVCAGIQKACEQAEDEPIKLRISLGTATSTDLKEDIDDLFYHAESLMYRNKLLTRADDRRAILTAMKQKLWIKSPENEEHSKRLVALAGKIAERIRLDSNDKRDLLHLAFMHDIGKINIPAEILEKPGKLTTDEWEIIKKHCEIGYRLAYAIGEPKLAEGILAHHEHFNGQGYPYGLKGEEIPLISRIIAVVDAYDVMIHERPYKEAYSQEKTIAELYRCSGTQFDPLIIQEFIDII
jgi:diguanylate cyclase (GGDEF)-like protein